MTLSAHIHGTGPLAYPEQDPRELAADLVSASVERVQSAFARFADAADDYRRTFGDPSAPEEFRSHAHRTQMRAASEFGRILEEHLRAMREMADGRPMVEEVKRG